MTGPDQRRDRQGDREAAHLRDHLAPRRRQDDPHREAAALRRGDPPGRVRQGAPRGAAMPPPTGWRWSGSAASRSPPPSCSSPGAAIRSTCSTRPGTPTSPKTPTAPWWRPTARSCCSTTGAGVEARTRQLFDVCKLRRMPIFTFVNKCDRPGGNPLQLVSDVEADLGLAIHPVTWPVMTGQGFVGVADRRRGEVLLFDRGVDHGATLVESQRLRLTMPPNSGRDRRRAPSPPLR